MTQTLALSIKTLQHWRESLMEAGRSVGNFFYATEKRTHYSIAFSYLCISLYLIAQINASIVGSCHG